VVGNITNEYVYFGGQRIARRDASGNVYYYVEDMLGSSRVITQANGTVCYDADFYPFGGERTPLVNTCPQNFKFNGKERDPETGLDDFGARYFSSSFGRWLSPDWSAIPAPVPYADLTNPQTLNLYQFVGNNPESFSDEMGHAIMAMSGMPPPRCALYGCEESEMLYGDRGTAGDGYPMPTVAAPMLGDDRPQASQSSGGWYNGQYYPPQNQNQNEAQKAQNIPGAANPPALQPPKPPVGDPSRDGAGTSAVLSINPTSIQQGVEYAGRVYKNPDGSYSYTAPNRGTVASSSHGSIGSLPPGTTNAGLYHTHGSATPGYDNEHFSPQDRGNARREHVPSYLATPGGKVLKFDPNTGRVTRLN
jgi:RHS repeat-associated protein